MCSQTCISSRVTLVNGQQLFLSDRDLDKLRSTVEVKHSLIPALIHRNGIKGGRYL